MKLSQELKCFIVSFCKEMNIKNIDCDDIGLDTSLDLDLNIFDLDLDVFFSNFSQRFNIDISLFEWGTKFMYPSGDDMSLLYVTFRSFDYKKKWVKKICGKLYKPKIYIRDIQNVMVISSQSTGRSKVKN